MLTIMFFLRPLLLLALLSPLWLQAEVASQYVQQGPDGKLVYWQDPQGNRIPDFSTCGYRGGGVPLPAVTVKVTLAPAEGDCAPAIQKAIDTVSALPPDGNGHRGAILLRKGTYHLDSGLRIRTGGVVLRGEGDGPDGTVLLATQRKKHTLISIGGEPKSGSRDQPVEIKGTRQPITDAYVPVGARTFSVPDGRQFRPGDTVIVFRPSTAEWITAIGMDRIPTRKDREIVQWTAGSRDIRLDRVVTAVRGDQIEIDAPIVCALDTRYGGGEIYKYEMPFRISEVGVENLRGDSVYSSPVDEDHAWTFINLGAVQNAWVRNVTAIHFAFACVVVSAPGKWITIQDSAYLEPVSQVSGGRRYSFTVNGQMVLVQRCRAQAGRHDFCTNGTFPGPIAFVDCESTDARAGSGPHQRWSTGLLFDNIRIQGSNLEIYDRGNFGTGHGWAGANSVIWNSTADQINCASPPTAQNWAIGTTSARHPKKGDCYWDSDGRPVTPASLYRAQLQDRLGPQALEALAPSAIP